MLCLYTGSALPAYCEPMLRDPQPGVGFLWDATFPAAYQFALALNTAVHDGAVAVGRANPKGPYRITAWSLRLFPPPIDRMIVPNRGSAFNSCQAMSLVSGVERMYLVTSGELIAFCAGSFRIVS
jgi:hypothetical protein